MNPKVEQINLLSEYGVPGHLSAKLVSGKALSEDEVKEAIAAKEQHLKDWNVTTGKLLGIM